MENSFKPLFRTSNYDDDDVGDDNVELAYFVSTSEHNRSCPGRMIYDKAEKKEKKILNYKKNYK